MRGQPHGVTGTRNEVLLRQLEVVMRERDVRPNEAEAFREGFIEGWRERGIAEPGTVNVTREYLADLEQRAGEGPEATGRTAMMDRVITPEKQEALALALEEAAQRVRQSIPSEVEIDVEDDVDHIDVGGGQSIPGMRTPLRRVFRIEWY